jgi:hypothetical protein
MQVLNHTIKDFHKEIYVVTECDLFDNLYDQNIDWDKFSVNSRQYKKLFFNYLSKTLLNKLSDHQGRTFYIIGKPDITKIHEYVTVEEFNYTYFLNIEKFFKLYPVNAVIVKNKTYEELIEDNPELNEWLIKEILKCKKKNSKKSFAKLSSFVKTYELSFLDKKIFDETKNRFIFN